MEPLDDIVDSLADPIGYSVPGLLGEGDDIVPVVDNGPNSYADSYESRNDQADGDEDWCELDLQDGKCGVQDDDRTSEDQHHTKENHERSSYGAKDDDCLLYWPRKLLPPVKQT